MTTIPEHLTALADAWRPCTPPPAPHPLHPGVIIRRALVGESLSAHLDAVVAWLDGPLAHGECTTACSEQHTYEVPCVLAGPEPDEALVAEGFQVAYEAWNASEQATLYDAVRATMRFMLGRVQPTAEPDLADELAEALRLTAEWSMATALPGWSWFDALQHYRAARGMEPLEATGLPAGITAPIRSGWLPEVMVAEAETRQELLRGALKSAREQLCRAQPQCVIVASRAQLQRALDTIDNVAHQEGVEPGDTFPPADDMPGEHDLEAALLDVATDPNQPHPFDFGGRLGHADGHPCALPGCGRGDRWDGHRGFAIPDDDVVEAVIHGEFTDAEAAMVAALAVFASLTLPTGATSDAVHKAAQVVRMARGAETPGWDEADLVVAIEATR